MSIVVLKCSFQDVSLTHTGTERQDRDSGYYVQVKFNMDDYAKIFFSLYTVIILNIGTDRSEQTVQTQIRLLLMEQSDKSLLCLLFCLHLLNTILHCKIQLFQL